MLVRDCMTRNPITVRPSGDPLAALAVLNAGRFRHLPVTEEDGTLVGIVARADLELFLSQAGSPGVMKRQHRIDQVMLREVATVTPDCPIEEAAAMMVRRKVGSLPVIEDNRVAGIITETDLFERFAAALSGSPGSVRLTVQLSDTPGQLAELAGRIARAQGNITSMVAFTAGEQGRQNITLRVAGVASETLVAAVEGMEGAEVLGVLGRRDSGEGR
ncbi:MAG: CBS and ACT domain-containing protein [Acidobacteriota bacterium]